MKLTQNDTAPALTGVCSSDDTPANLTGASLAVHVLRPDGSVITRTGMLVDAAAGSWSMAWQVGDLAQVGRHRVEVEVTYSGGTRQTFGREAFTVQAELG